MKAKTGVSFMFTVTIHIVGPLLTYKAILKLCLLACTNKNVFCIYFKISCIPVLHGPINGALDGILPIEPAHVVHHLVVKI